MDRCCSQDLSYLVIVDAMFVRTQLDDLAVLHGSNSLSSCPHSVFCACHGPRPVLLVISSRIFYISPFFLFLGFPTTPGGWKG